MSDDMAEQLELCKYIAPGEFSFCPRCGMEETCTAGDTSKWCNRCLGNGEPVPPSAYPERQRIARERKRSGVKPLFWMEGL